MAATLYTRASRSVHAGSRIQRGCGSAQKARHEQGRSDTTFLLTRTVGGDRDHQILATAALATLAALGTAGAADPPMPAPVYKASPAAAGVVALNYAESHAGWFRPRLVWRFN